MTTALRAQVEPLARRERTTAVAIQGLSKRFTVRREWREILRHPTTVTRTLALDDVTLDVASGEFFGLLGPNGAGKTTLFKTLATLVLPDTGTAVVEGHDIVAEPAAVRRVLTPVSADERSLNWRLTATENLELYAVLHRVPRAERRDRIRQALADVELADTGTKLAGASSGMRQRLLIARALLARPRVLLLDEPTRSLDPISARTFRQFLRDEIVGRHGCTVVLATHSAEEAFDLCDRVAVLDRGRVLACGPAQQLARQHGERKYRLWTTEPNHHAFASLVAIGSIERHTVVAERDGDWQCVEIVLGAEQADGSDVLARLVGAGLPLARFEQISLSLADLLERVVTTHRRPANA